MNKPIEEQVVSDQQVSNNLELRYGGQHDVEATKAIINEKIEKLDLTNTQLVIDVADINLKTPDEYTLLRRNGFGGSDSSVLLGVNPFKTLDELIKEKLSKGISEEERAIGELTSVRMGRDLEPLIIEKFRQHFKQEIIKPSDMYKFINYPYLKLNFDGVTGTPEQYIPAEIKVVTSKGERHYNPTKAIYNEMQGFLPLQPDPTEHNWSIETKALYYGIPPYYYTQLQQEMFGLNAPFGYLAVLFERDWRFYVFHVWKDQKVWDALVVQGYKAWEKIEMMRGVVSE